jgi:ubiquitin carboxyl-terminal hydrolase 4/11/15
MDSCFLVKGQTERRASRTSERNKSHLEQPAETALYVHRRSIHTGSSKPVPAGPPPLCGCMQARDGTASPARSSSLTRKRPLSSSSASPSTASATKRANSEDHMTSSDHEGSIGASRLNIDSTPLSPASPSASNRGSPAGPASDPDATLNSAAPPTADEDLPPAYDAPVRQDDDDDDEEAEDLPTFASSSHYNGPAADQQLAMITEMKQFQLEKDETWYLVPRGWYRRWQTACSGIAQSKEDDDSLTPEQVGPIDTTVLTEADGVTLRKPLQVGVDVEVLPTPGWRYLTEWCVQG